MKEVSVKDGNRWVKLDVEYIKDILRRVYKASGQKELGLGIILAESYGDTRLKEDISFLKKLIQLEASGYVIPPLSFADLYLQVAEPNHRMGL